MTYDSKVLSRCLLQGMVLRSQAGLPPLVVDLVRRLLKREPSQRLPLDQVLRQELLQGLGSSGDTSFEWDLSGKA